MEKCGFGGTGFGSLSEASLIINLVSLELTQTVLKASHSSLDARSFCEAKQVAANILDEQLEAEIFWKLDYSCLKIKIRFAKNVPSDRRHGSPIAVLFEPGYKTRCTNDSSFVFFSVAGYVCPAPAQS